MQAIILAAGMGKRLKELTRDNTKCMIKVNGVTLIERMLRQLDALNLSRIVIVVGYKRDRLIDFVKTLPTRMPIDFIENPIFDKTNNIYSLALAKDYLVKEDSLLLESDLIFEDGVLHELVADPRASLALVSKYESWMDGTCVKIDDNDNIEAFVPGKRFAFADIPKYYKTVNIYKFSQHFSATKYVPFLEAYQAALGENEYYEQVLRVITMLDQPEIKAKKLTNYQWYEIDDIQDLDIAASMFTENDDQKVKSISGRYGGYWRYPHLIDFCYLVNPYYPPQRLMDEMKANFEHLMCGYPSGMRVNTLLAAKNFGLDQKYIVVGNGAAELIKSIIPMLDGRLGIVRPTFEEYPNRIGTKDIVEFNPDNDNLSYNADDLIDFASSNTVKTLLVINPDNPSGNYIPRQEVLRLINWCGTSGIRLIIDESFIDFADESTASILDNAVLSENPHLVVIKSISKSFGVPGVRLGLLASGDTALIEQIRKDVAIWNINSFGEFFLQIMEKYESDYQCALERFRKERIYFFNQLSKNKSLRVIPSQANYFLTEILGGMTSREVVKRLLLEHSILIKDATPKIKHGERQFLRIAIRNKEDNSRIVTALQEVLQ